MKIKLRIDILRPLLLPRSSKSTRTKPTIDILLPLSAFFRIERLQKRDFEEEVYYLYHSSKNNACKTKTP